MKITRGTLSEMIAVEVRRRLRELVEKDERKDGEEKGGDGKKRPRRPQTADASDSPSPQGDVPAGPRATTGSPSVSTPEVDQDADDDGPAVDGDGPDPVAADDPEDDGDEADAIDPEGEGGEDESGAVNDEVSGKTVQAVTVEPRSKMLPGAREVVVTFNESTDALRILVTPTGQIKFAWRGQLFDLP